MPSSGVQTCALRSEEHTSELQSLTNLVCRLLLEKTINNYGKIIIPCFVLCLLPSVLFCVKLDYSYSLKDTRTTAKEWIETNVPFGSKILMDMYPHCPPLKQTKQQLENLYKRALALNHYKKEYLKLQLDAYVESEGKKIFGYEIHNILRLPKEISGTIDMVKEAQKTQDLVDVSGGSSLIKKSGIKYFIYNSWDETSGLASEDRSLADYYKNINNNFTLIKEFSPADRLHPGPVIRIYRTK